MLRHRHWGQVLRGQCLWCMHKSRAVVEVVQEVQLLLLSRGRCLSCMLLAYQTSFWLSVPIIAPLPPPASCYLLTGAGGEWQRYLWHPTPNPPSTTKSQLYSPVNWIGQEWKHYPLKIYFCCLDSICTWSTKQQIIHPEVNFWLAQKLICTLLLPLGRNGQCWKWSVTQPSHQNNKSCSLNSLVVIPLCTFYNNTVDSSQSLF